MPGKKDPIRRLQLVLCDNCAIGDARAQARRAVEGAGMSLSGEGVVTLSARMSDSEFRKTFPVPVAASDALPVPDQLKPYVKSISEAPEHLSFD